MYDVTNHCISHYMRYAKSKKRFNNKRGRVIAMSTRRKKNTEQEKEKQENAKAW